MPFCCQVDARFLQSWCILVYNRFVTFLFYICIKVISVLYGKSFCIRWLVFWCRFNFFFFLRIENNWLVYLELDCLTCILLLCNNIVKYSDFLILLFKPDPVQLTHFKNQAIDTLIIDRMAWNFGFITLEELYF